MPFQITLGAIAGATIFLGLPIAVLPRVGEKTRGFLNAASTGIVLFLLLEIMGQMMEWIEDLFQSSVSGFPQLHNALLYSGLLILGLSCGLLGMIYFERAFIHEGKDEVSTPGERGRHISKMIATGIGIHNLTEGMAIAQAYSWGDHKLAILLALGFGLHNATEGFGIAAPLSGQKPSWKFLLTMGLIGGGPTFLGAILGSYWQSDVLKIFTMSLAAGTLLYLIGELMHLGRHLKGETIVEIGLLVGFSVAFATEMILVLVGF